MERKNKHEADQVRDNRLTRGSTRLYHAMNKETRTRVPVRNGTPRVDSSSMLRKKQGRWQ
jgi:hypothetical protein